MKKKLFYSILSCTYSLGICYSQDLLWEKSFGGKHAEHFTDMIPTADYGFIIGGSSFSSASGDKTNASKGDLDFWIWKMDEHGSMEWQKSYGGEGTDILKKILNTSDGGLLISGTTSSKISGDKKDDSYGANDTWLIKLNAMGQEEWQLTLGGDLNEDLIEILQTQDNGYLIGINSNSSISGNKTTVNINGNDIWLVKINSKGKIEWEKLIGGDGADLLKAIIETEDQGYLIGAYTNSNQGEYIEKKPLGKGDILLVKIDKDGNYQWQERYGGDQEDILTSIITLNDGNILIAGNSYSDTSTSKTVSNRRGGDLWIIKTNEFGHSLWQQSYNIDEHDMLVSVQENNDGTLVMGAYSSSSKLFNAKKNDFDTFKDFIIIKTDADGDEKWRKSIGSQGNDVLKSVILLRDGSYLLGGTTEGEISKDRTSWKGQKDIWIVKLADKDKEKEDRNKIEVYPNPTLAYSNVVVTYEYDRGIATMFDINGRSIQTVELNGQRTIPFNLTGLPHGVYLVEVKTNISKNTVKILKY